MTLIVRCEDKHRLVAYLYGEAAPEEQSAVESHLATCAACAAELSGLRDVRGHLAEWQAPDADLGFTLTRSPVLQARVRRSWSLPVWAQAAAAVLVLSAGAAIANLEIRYGRDGFSVRTGWQQPAPTPATRAARRPQPTALTTADASDTWKKALADSENRLRAEFAAQRVIAPASPVMARTGASDDETLRQVRALIEQSERRQERALAMRVAQVAQDFELQRRTDLVRIEQNMGQIEGVTGAEAARQRELLNYLMRVSQRR